MTTVTVSATYALPGGGHAAGRVTFTPSPVVYVDRDLNHIVTSTVAATLDSGGSLSVTLQASDDPDINPTGWTYLVTEQITGCLPRAYSISVPAADAGSGLNLATVTPVGPSSGSVAGPFTPQVTEILGAATGTFTDVTGTYQIPAGATMITFDAMAGGGGGGSGGADRQGFGLFGGGGGGGGGRTTKTVPAALLRAAYPGGVPYTVGHGGQGAAVNTNHTAGAQGPSGTAGGYTFAGDFFVAVPGGATLPAQGGGHGTIYHGYPGSYGDGDTRGGVGGAASGWAKFNIGAAAFPVFGPTPGGFVLPIQVGSGAIGWQANQGGGGGGGGGGGSIEGNSQLPTDGGPSGFANTADTTPITGLGGVVGGANPTTAGIPAAGVTIPHQGGGGGGAGSITGNGQNGASAANNSASGGGGGGASTVGNGGAGGNGGSGWLRIIAT